VDANVSWVDQKNNQTIKLTKVSVVSEDIVSGKKFPLTIKFNIAGLPDHLSGEYELNADITLDTQNNLYTLDDFKFNVTMPAENSYEIKGSANKITLDLPDQTLDVVDFKASGNALEMEADLHVEQLVEAPVYTGNLNVKSSNLRNFLKAIKKEVQTKDTNVLGNFSFSANFRGTDNSLRLDAVNLHLDDSISKGNANITSFKPLAVDFNQTIDQLNVDRYRKPDASPSPAMSTEQASALPSQPTVSADTSNKTDFASLRKLTIGGGLNIGLLTVGETEFSQVHVQLLLQNGVLNVSPFTAQVHGGKAQSQITANFQENVPHYAIHSIVSHVDLAKVSQSEHVVGLINLNMQLTTQGVTKKEMLASLNGALQFDVEKGSLKGVNIPFEIDRALALAKKQPLPQPPAINETEFGVFSGSGMIQNGVFSNNDLLMQSSKFKVTGQGTANIVSEMIDYRLRAVGMETIKNADGTEIEKERQTEIPLIVTGTFSKPIVAPDVIAIARGLLKEKLQQKIDQNFQSAKEKAVELKDKVQETTEKTAEDAKEKAGQLFQQLLQ
jgi:AsmA protein